MFTDRLRWLHLSDFHTGKDPFGQKMMFKHILEHIAEKIASGFAPDLIFLTGDIANKGNPTEYKTFTETFFRPLLATLSTSLGEECARRIFLIPGNHDVTREKMNIKLYDLFSNNPNLLDVAREGARLRKQFLYPRFQAYMNAAIHKSVTTNMKWLDSVESSYISVLDILKDNHKIGILGLNTAWLSCGQEDRHEMTPGKYIVECGLTQLAEAGCDTYLVLGHHPIDWFRDEDIGPIRALLGQYQAIYLHGHLHKTSGRQDEGAGHTFLTVQSGAAFQARDDEKWINQLLWCELNYRQRRVLVDPMQWSPENRSWIANAGAFPPPNQVPGRSRWFLRLPRSAEELTEDDLFLEEDFLDVPSGWLHINKQFLAAERKKPVDAQQILRYYDGSFPNWPMILSRHKESDKANIPEREIVGDMQQHLEQARQTGFPGVTVLLSGGGEGKTTALMQVVCRLVQADNDWNILWHNDEEQDLPKPLLENLVQTGRTWLIVSDDADCIGRDVHKFVETQHKKGHNNVHFLLCCRDTDWRADGLHALPWGLSSAYKETPLHTLLQADAEKVIDAWGMYGQEGLRDMAKLPRPVAIQQLMEKARDTSNKDGSFLGAMLQVRIGGGLREHVSLLLSHLEKRTATGGSTLLDAFAYIAATHIRTDLELPRVVLARILHCSSNELSKYVIMPLGEEASIATSSQYIYTRHHAIARVAIQLLEERFGLNLEEIYIILVSSAVEAFLENRYVPNIAAWNYVASHFFEEGQKDFGLRLAEELVKIDPTDFRFIAELSKLYRKSGKYEQSIQMFHDIAEKIGKDRSYDRLRSARGFYYEWATTEGIAGNLCIDAWLSGVALADEISFTMPDNEQAKRSLAGLALVFGRLFEESGNRSFIEACAGAAHLGLMKVVQLDSRAEKNLRTGYNQAKKEGIVNLEPVHALDHLQRGIATAYEQREDDLIEWLIPGNELHFTKLAQRLGISHDR